MTEIMTRHCISLGTGASKQGGFQLYSVLPDVTVAPIPDSLTFGRAAVLPLPLSTATASLYQTDFLGLPLPRNGAQPTGQTILVWGGSSSVGSCAIQLAAASGLKVVTTASKKNFAAVTALGAEYVFDYESETVIDDVVASLKNTKFAGAIDTISKPPTMKASAEIVHRVGGIKKLVTMIPPPEDLPEDVEAKGGMFILATIRGGHDPQKSYMQTTADHPLHSLRPLHCAEGEIHSGSHLPQIHSRCAAERAIPGQARSSAHPRWARSHSGGHESCQARDVSWKSCRHPVNRQSDHSVRFHIVIS